MDRGGGGSKEYHDEEDQGDIPYMHLYKVL